MTEITSRLATALADRYKLQRHLGEGGMATVYLAEDLKHHRKVAVKVLRSELAALIGPERFLKEIEVTANLQHPHILPLHDSGDADGFLFYVMPYVEGETLRDKLNREKQLDIDEAIKITEAVASALDYAHRHEVIHRDIKPENILLHDGQAMVADFGIALAVSQAGGTRLTETGLSIGTPQYMSPEQAMGDRELDARSDVYSLGAMLYEMLAGDHGRAGHRAESRVGVDPEGAGEAAGRSVPLGGGVCRGADASGYGAGHRGCGRGGGGCPGDTARRALACGASVGAVGSNHRRARPPGSEP
jgi:serine/threonine-protein kinase